MSDGQSDAKPSALKSIYLELLLDVGNKDKIYTVEQLTQYIIEKEKDED